MLIISVKEDTMKASEVWELCRVDYLNIPAKDELWKALTELERHHASEEDMVTLVNNWGR